MMRGLCSWYAARFRVLRAQTACLVGLSGRMSSWSQTVSLRSGASASGQIASILYVNRHVYMMV